MNAFRDYQKFAINEIIKKPSVALMLDMGLGKTAIALTAIKELKLRTLIIAPLRVAQSTWNDECLNWSHLKNFKIAKVLGTEKERIAALNSQADAYIINRENIIWLVKYLGKGWFFEMVVIDESSSFKNPSAKRFRALKHIRPRLKRVVLLTGTPAPNGLLDLWSQVYLLDRGIRLGTTLGEYQRTYFTAGARDGHIVYEWKLLKGADKAIYKKIADICVSMKSSDYLKLPELIYNKINIKLPADKLAKYRELEKDLVAEIDETELAVTSAAALSTKLLQLANGAVYDEMKNVIKIHDEKLLELSSILEISNNILVFYWFKHDLERLKEAFPFAVELKSSANLKAWNSGKVKMLLAHPASAGHGLNLQYGGSVIVWFGLTWSLELYQQANKRLHRSGQVHNVIIHHLLAEGTIDYDVMAALEAKDVSQERLLNAIKNRLYH